MPKRILGLTLVVASLVLASCAYNNGNPYAVGATATPTVPPASPNPAFTSAVVTVTVSASPLPNQAVAISTPDATGHAGAAFATQLTDATGKTTFTPLTGAATYCFSTTYTPTPPALAQTQAPCTAYWGNANGVNLNF